MTRRWQALVCALVVVAAACGGGGDDDDRLSLRRGPTSTTSDARFGLTPGDRPASSTTVPGVAPDAPVPPLSPPPAGATDPGAPPAPAPTPGAPAGPVELAVTDVATGLNAPWALAFLPDGTALVSERDSGRVLSVGAGGALREVQRLAVTARGEGGLLGLAVSPDFARDGLVYAYHSTGSDNRVVRFRLGQPPQPVLTGIPVAGNHNGGRIAFGPDGLLYVATGDAGEPGRSQDPRSLAGKILRIHPDGSVPAGNPFGASAVWSLGHRNVQGLAWRGDGRMYATEFGQNTFDEVNEIVPGANYGWPVVEGRAGDGRFTDPIAQWSPAEASPSGAVVLAGGAIPQWEGDVLFAGLRGQRLWRVDLDAAGGVAGTEAHFTGDFGRLRHVAQAPDGSLWVLTNNTDGRGEPRSGDDRILRIGPR